MSTDAVGVGRGVHETDPSGDRLIADRRISRQGNSQMIAVPPAFMRRLNLYPGDTVRLTLDPEMGGYFVRPKVERVFRPPLPPAPPATSEGER